METWIAECIRACEIGEFFERAREHRLVTDAVMGRAEGAAHWVIDKNRARRRYFAHDVVGGADHQCRNALAFDHMGDETDGLMAEGSIGHEQSEIDLGLLQVVGDGWSQRVFNPAMIAQAAHEGKVKRCQAADDASLL